MTALIPDGNYTIRIDGDGVLTKEYRERGEIYKTRTRNLSHSQLTELIEAVLSNGFFSLSEDLTDNTGPTSQPVRRLSITYDGKSHVSGGYGVRNSEFLAICRLIERFSP
jgi:hypothetical protein